MYSFAVNALFEKNSWEQTMEIGAVKGIFLSMINNSLELNNS